jgi:hypothetical protein
MGSKVHLAVALRHVASSHCYDLSVNLLDRICPSGPNGRCSLNKSLVATMYKSSPNNFRQCVDSLNNCSFMVTRMY